MLCWRGIHGELVGSRFLIAQLLKREMFGVYKQSVLGTFWIVLVPLVTVGTFILLRSGGVVAEQELTAPYPVFAGLGVTIWQIFAKGLVAGASSLARGGALITRINVSRKSLVIASMGQTVVAFVVLMLLMTVIFAVFLGRGWDWSPGPAALLFPFALIPLVFFTVGLAMWLSLINALVRDIMNLMSVMVTLLMLLTPILYLVPPPVTGERAALLSTINTYNPLNHLVGGPRDLLLEGFVHDPAGFWISTALATLIFCFSIVAFHITEKRIAERI